MQTIKVEALSTLCTRTTSLSTPDVGARCADVATMMMSTLPHPMPPIGVQICAPAARWPGGLATWRLWLGRGAAGLRRGWAAARLGRGAARRVAGRADDRGRAVLGDKADQRRHVEPVRHGAQAGGLVDGRAVAVERRAGLCSCPRARGSACTSGSIAAASRT